MPTEAEPASEPEKEESKDPRPEDIKADLVEPEEDQPRVVIKKKQKKAKVPKVKLLKKPHAPQEKLPEEPETQPVVEQAKPRGV